MSLIACPSCAREVNGAAGVCPDCGAPVGERGGGEGATFQELWEADYEPEGVSEFAQAEHSDTEDGEPPRFFPVGELLLRIVALWAFGTGLLLWYRAANRIVDRIVLGSEAAPLPVDSLIASALAIGTGGVLIWWGGLRAIKDTRIERWVRKNVNRWAAFGIGFGVFMVYIVGMSLVAAATAERELVGSVWVSLDGGTCRDAQGSAVEEGTSVVVFDLTGRELAVAQLADRRENDGACIFGFRLSGIPTTENAYDLLINEQFWSLNRADLDAGEWRVDLINPDVDRR